jgi:membrane protease YdiL (CAAX protease family)
VRLRFEDHRELHVGGFSWQRGARSWHAAPVRVRRWAPGLWILLAAAGARAALPAPGEPGSAARWVEALREANEQRAEEMLARFERRVAEAPDDAGAAVERCRFLALAFYDLDTETNAREEEHAACVAELEERFANDPDVRVALIEDLGGGATEAAETFLADPPESTEPRHLAAVHAHLAGMLFEDDVGVGHHAEEAMKLDPSRDLRVEVARGLIATGDSDGARALLLTGLFDTTETSRLEQKASLLTELGAFDDAVAAFREAERREGEPSQHEDLPRALAGAGDLEGARAAWAALDGRWLREETRRARFQFELAHGDEKSASAAYEALIEDDELVDIFGQDRFALFLAHPTAPWKPDHLFGFGALAGVLFTIALVPGLWILPVAWAGLGRRRRADTTPSRAGFGLRHAWLVSALYLVVEVLAFGIYVGAGENFGEATGGESYARYGVASAIAGLAAVLLVVRARLFGLLGPGAWSARRTLLSGAAAAAAVMLGLAAVEWATSVETADPATVELVQAINEHYGVGVSLLVLALLVPLVEEIIFRGVLLAAFTRYLGPRWANLAQATLFGIAHFHPVVTPWAFVIGLMAGGMTRRAGTLRPAVWMHVVVNAAAGVSIAAGY